MLLVLLGLPFLLKGQGDVSLQNYLHSFEDHQSVAAFLAADSLLQQHRYFEQLPPSAKLSLFDFYFQNLQRATWSTPSLREGLVRMEREKFDQYIELAFVAQDSAVIEKTIQYLEIQRSLFGDKLVAPSPINRKLSLLQQIRAQLKIDYQAALGDQAKTEIYAEIKTLEDQIRALNNQRSTLEGEPKAISFEQLRAQISDNEAFLLYYVGVRYTYAILLSQGQAKLFKLVKTDRLFARVTQFQNTIHPYLRKELFAADSYWLYQQLWLPLVPFLDNIDHIYLLPDQFLGGLGFEHLTTERPSDWDRSYQSLHYLIQDYRFSYQHSLGTFLQFQLQTASTKPAPRVLALAPVYDEKMKQQLLGDTTAQTLPAIPQTEVLLKNVAQQFDGTYLIGEKATSDRFLQEFPRHDIIQLLAHTIVPEDNPIGATIALAPTLTPSTTLDYMTINTLLTLSDSIQADMIILSSCRTGNGRIQSGESIGGLAQEFSLFGVPKLIYSLWSVDADATCALFDQFYDHLSEGTNPSAALHLAKLELMESASGKYSAPYFWSGFHFYGTTSGYQVKANKSTGVNYSLKVLYLIGALIPLGLGIWWYRKRLF